MNNFMVSMNVFSKGGMAIWIPFYLLILWLVCRRYGWRNTLLFLAALVPLYLGVRAVIAKSFARIHAANLINAGILPLTFAAPDDYDALTQGETLTLTGIDAGLDSGTMTLHAGNREIPVCGSFTKRQAAMLRAGGLLNYTKEGND